MGRYYSITAIFKESLLSGVPFIRKKKIDFIRLLSVHIMAQGSGKLGGSGGKKKSAGSQRRKTVKIKKKKGKGSSKVESKDKGIVAATKQINRKNQRQISTRNKRQGKATKLSDRLQVSIDKCGAV